MLACVLITSGNTPRSLGPLVNRGRSEGSNDTFLRSKLLNRVKKLEHSKEHPRGIRVVALPLGLHVHFQGDTYTQAR